MELRSLGLRTEVMLAEHRGHVRHRADYIAIETPDNPTYYWGNCLIFAAAPSDESALESGERSWRRIFEREFGHNPAVRHQTFTWDEPGFVPGHSDAFKRLGFERDELLVLSAREVVPPAHVNRELRIEAVVTDDAWKNVTNLLVQTREPHFDEQVYTRYMEKKTLFFRHLTMTGAGVWYGAYLGNDLCGVLGLVERDGLGRFQEVATHPDFRRLGVCGTLVHHVAALALMSKRVSELVMIADPHYVAARIYESIGFTPIERLYTLERTERSAPSTSG